ncbi:MAG: recombinase family protein [Eggerthellaceae bacterium]|nr:recombinase family protein [Eggerthellaceae bacterium]
MIKTAVIYARFSCSKQREASIEDQLRVCSDWCEREGYRIVAQYCDYAISGRTDARPQFQLMMDRAGESDIVLVYMMDRFSRDAYDAPIYKKRLRDRGVRVVSATENLPDGPDAVLLEKIYEGLAAVESAHISARTKRGMEGNALKCLYNGDRVFGYAVDPETKKYVVDDEQAPVVRECFSRRVQGESINSIARSMAARGVRTYRGKPCSQTMVHNIIKNVRYRGVYKWGDVEVPGGMPAIVSEEEWVMANRVVSKKQRKSEEWGEYALSGKAVCAGCGHNFVGVSGRGRNGVKYSYYRCSKRCGEVSPISQSWIESHIAEALREFVSNREQAVEIGRIVEAYVKSADAHRDADRARKAVADADRALENIQRAIEMGVFTEGTQERIVELQDERTKAQAFLAGMADYELDAEGFADFLQYAATLTDEKMIDLLVWQVLVGEEEILVTLNYDVEPEIPQRFTIDGFAKISEWGIKQYEHPGERVFVQNVSGSPFAALYETSTGYAVVVHAGKVAIAMRRAA